MELKLENDPVWLGRRSLCVGGGSGRGSYLAGSEDYMCQSVLIVNLVVSTQLKSGIFRERVEHFL